MTSRYSSKRPPPIDRGWAWAILLAQFVQQMVGSSIYMTGLFNVAFLEEFGLSPLSSVLVASLGARRTVFIGVIMTMFGYFVSAFVDSFFVLCLTYGVITGMGVGFTYLPGVVMMGFYFNDYRNFAFGVVTMGVGIGQMWLAPLVNFLIDTYGWRGTMIILSAITAHFAVAGAVLRPIDFDPEFLYEDDDDDESAAPSVDKGMLNCTFNQSNDSVSNHGSILHLSQSSNHVKLPRNLSENLIQYGVPALSTGGLKPAAGAQDAPGMSNYMTSIKSDTCYPLLEGTAVNECSNNKNKAIENKTFSNNNGQMLTNTHSRIYYPKHLRTGNVVTGPDKFHSSASIYLGSSTSIAQPVNNTISQSSTHINCNVPYRLHSPRMQRVISPLQRVLDADGILARMSSDYIGRSYSSINDLAKASLPVAHETHNLDDSFVEYSIDSSLATSKLQEAILVIKNLKFSLYCLSVLAVTLGQGVVYLHLPAFAISTGTSPAQASYLLAVMGLANIVSRFLSGLVTSGNRCSSLTVYNISLALNGAFLLVAPNMGQTYLGQVAVAAIFSLFGNCYCAIMTPLAIEFVGLSGLSIASGLLLLASGVGFLCGSPIAGMLFDISGSYTTTFYFAGISVIVGVVIMLAVSVLVNRENRKQILT